LANAAIPLGQKLGLISFALSQFVTINSQSDVKLNDGSAAHQYSISASVDQLRKLKAPMDKALDVVLITTQQHDKTYIVVYATEAGRMSQYQSAFDGILNSVTIGSASFSNMGQMTAENAVPGNDTQIFQKDTSISNLAPVPMTDSPPTGDTTMMIGNSTGATAGDSVTIAPGSSDPSNGKFFIPNTLTVSKGTTVTWINDDGTLHTVTSGSPEAGNSGTEFDSSYLAAGKTFQHQFNTPGTFDFYCTLHPYMTGNVVVS
jgi:plastocyanin